MIEREIKIAVKDIPSLVNSLEKLGAKFIGFAKQTTYRLDTKSMDLEKRGVFLRTRTGLKSTITIKKRIGSDVKVKTREETEIRIEDVEKMNKILKEIGFDWLRIMEKYRAEWRYDDLNLDITIDELPFGFYMEAEGSEESISKYLERINKQGEERIIQTYWSLNKEWKKSRNSNNEDIIFETQESSLKKILKECGVI